MLLKVRRMGAGDIDLLLDNVIQYRHRPLEIVKTKFPGQFSEERAASIQFARKRNIIHGDEALDKACKFAQAYGAGDHVDGPQLAIGVLQHVRKALLGRFNRIQADHQLSPAPMNEGIHEA